MVAKSNPLSNTFNNILALREDQLVKIFDKKIISFANLNFSTMYEVGKELGAIVWNKESKKETFARNLRNGLIDNLDQLARLLRSPQYLINYMQLIRLKIFLP